MSRQHIDRDKTTPRSASDAFDLGPETSEVEGLSIEALELSPTEPTHEQILEWAAVRRGK